MCVNEKQILNKRYLPTKKNGFNPPKCKDERARYVPAKCGYCIECKKTKARNWKIRLIEELKYNKTHAVMVTLTIDTPSYIELTKETEGKGYKKQNNIISLASRRFFERYRKKNGKYPRYWLVSELGQKNHEHIHMHGIIWTEETIENIKKLWKYGHAHVSSSKENKGWVNIQTINYIVKYVTKPDTKHKYFKPIVRNSKGMGLAYIKTHDAKQNKKLNPDHMQYRLPNGKNCALPDYYKNHIYTDAEKETLFTNNISNPFTYIQGEKILKTDYKNIEEAMKIIKAKSIEMGYITEINEKEKQKEEEERHKKHLKRLQLGYIKK
jgi:hypothetical protein